MSSPKVRVVQISFGKVLLFAAIGIFVMVKLRLFVPLLILVLGVPLAIGYGIYRLYRSALLSAEAARVAFERQAQQTTAGYAGEAPVTIEICPRCGCEKAICRC